MTSPKQPKSTPATIPAAVPTPSNNSSLKRLQLNSNEKKLLDEITAELTQLSERRTGMIIAVAKLNGLKVQAVEYSEGALHYVPLMINEQQENGDKK